MANHVPKHYNDCRTAQAGADIPATHVSLDSLSVHRLQPGHYVAPLLWAGSTSLPFAAGLELFSGSCNEYGMGGEDFSLPELPESDGLLSLQYILDGRAQVNLARVDLHCSSTHFLSLATYVTIFFVIPRWGKGCFMAG